MDKLHKIMDGDKKMMKFIWRYLFVLIFSLLVLLKYPFDTITLDDILTPFMVAALLDWIKYNARFKSRRMTINQRSGITPSLQSSNPGNYHMTGTSTNISGIGHRF